MQRRKLRFSNRRGSKSLEQLVIFAFGVLVLGGAYFVWNAQPENQGISSYLVKSSVTGKVRTTASDTDSAISSNWMSDAKVMVFLAGGIFAFLAWSSQKIFDFVMLRAKLAVLEILSDGRPRTLATIIEDVRNRKSLHRLKLNFFRGSITDGLAELVNDGKVDVENRKYLLRPRQIAE